MHDGLKNTGKWRNAYSGRNEHSMLSAKDVTRWSSIRSVDGNLFLIA